MILVDTGLPAGPPEEKPDETSPAYTGKDICSYMEAFAALGYKPEQVTKILLTHKHSDQSGEIRSFPNAKIYVGGEELSAAELQGVPNLVPVQYTDGAYYNFPESQKIGEGITMIRAKGHTNGNSIVIVEKTACSICSTGTLPTWMKRCTPTSCPWCLTIGPPPGKPWTGCGNL